MSREYLCYTDKQTGYTFLNGVDVAPKLKPVYAFEGNSLITEAKDHIDWNRVKLLVSTNGGYIIERKQSGKRIENSEEDVLQYSVKGVDRSAEFYLSGDKSAVVYVDSKYSRVIVENSDQTKNRVDDYFMSISNLTPNMYLATTMNEAIGQACEEFAFLHSGLVQKVSLDYVSGIEADYYAYKDGQLLAAFGLRSQQCVMTPVPIHDKAIDAVASILKGELKYTLDGEEHVLGTTIMLNDNEHGVVFDEDAKRGSEDFYKAMQNGFRDQAGKVVQIETGFCKMALKPLSSGAGLEGQLLYVYQNRDQLANRAKDLEQLCADAIIYVINDTADFAKLDADVISCYYGLVEQELETRSEADPSTVLVEKFAYGYLVNAGVNTILSDAYKIYNAAKAEALLQYCDILHESMSGLQGELEAQFPNILKQLIVETAKKVPYHENEMLDTYFYRTNKYGGISSGFSGVDVNFDIKPRLPKVERFSGEKTPVNAKLKLKEYFDSFGDAIEIVDASPEQAGKIVEVVAATLSDPDLKETAKQALSGLDLSVPGAALRYTGEQGTSIKKEVMESIQRWYSGAGGDSQVSMEAEVVNVLNNLGNCLRYLTKTKFTEWKNNKASYTVSDGPFGASKSFSETVLPEGWTFEKNFGVQSASITGAGTNIHVCLDLAITSNHGYQRGLFDGKQLYENVVAAFQKHLPNEMSQSGMNLKNLTFTWTGVKGRIAGQGSGPKATDIPVSWWLPCHHWSEDGRRNSDYSVNHKPSQIGLFSCEFDVERSIMNSGDTIIRLAYQNNDVKYQKLDQESAGLAGIPFTIFLMKHAEQLEDVQSMDPVGFVEETFLHPNVLKSFYDVTWADGDVLANAIAAADQVYLLQGEADTEYKKNSQLLRSIFNKMKENVNGSLEEPVSKTYWLTEAAVFAATKVGEIGVLPLFLDFCV